MLELGFMLLFILLLYATARGNELRNSSGSMGRVHLVLEEGRRQSDLENHKMELKHEEYISAKYPNKKFIFEDDI